MSKTQKKDSIAKNCQNKIDVLTLSKEIKCCNLNNELKDLEQQVNDIINSYKKQGFIDYYNAQRCADKLYKFMSKKNDELLCEEKVEEDIQFIIYCLKKFTSTNMDDDGEISFIVDNGIYFLKVISENFNSVNEKKVLFNEIFKVLKSSNENLWFLKEQFENFVFDNLVCKELSDKILKYVNAKINELKQKEKRYYLNHYLKAQIKIFRLLNNLKELERLKTEYKDYKAIQLDYIDELKKNKQYEEAIKFLKQQHSNANGISESERCLSLQGIYKETGDEINYHKELLEYFLKHDCKIEEYKKLKDSYKNCEWIKVKNDVIKQINNEYVKAQVYEEEKMYDELLKFISSEDGNYLFKKYEKVLFDKFQDKLLILRKNYITDLAKKANARNKYKEVVRELKTLIKKYDFGYDVAEILIQSFRQQYSKKTAFMEELNMLILITV